MHITFRAIASRVAPALAAALVVASAQPVFADVPLPILDIVPQQFYTVNTNVDPPGATAASPIPPDDGFVVGGTATLPIFKGFSLSYDNIQGGAFDTALTAQGIPGVGSVYPGPARDVLQNYRGDYHIGSFNLEAGFGTRHRECCPYGGLEWHKAFVGISYATPHFSFLNGGFFVLDITGNANSHYSSPAALASFGTTASATNSKLYTSQQAVTAVVPIDLKNGVRVAGTWLWGYLDYPENGPFDYKYNVIILAATKQFSNEIGLTGNVTNVTQMQQGYPFPTPGAIHTTALALALDFHIDFHHLLATAPRPSTGRPTQPGAPGGPGGPAPIGPTQGGAVSPAPSASPEMMNQSMPASSPAPAPAPSPSP